MKVMITGIDGYIGSILAPKLMRANYEVIGLDTGFYRSGWLYNDCNHSPYTPLTLNKDIRNITPDDLEGVNAVIHLAELSNDPLGQNNPETTFKINHQGSVHIAALCKEMGVERFIYTSSCSVYGAGTGEFLDETNKVNPQTAYAQCKVNVERDVSSLADDRFTPVFLRNATAYGASPRMRFDIVLNNLAGLAWTKKEINMTSDGTPWRPLVHIDDICHAIQCALEAPKETIHNEIFNVGHNEDNYRVRDIAEITAEVFDGCHISIGENRGDNRSYRVNFDKINSQLPKFKCSWNAQSGARQLYDFYKRIDMSTAVFNAKPFTRLSQLEHLIETNQINSDFFWTVGE